MTVIPAGDPGVVAAVEAIRGGDVARLRRLLADHPDLATARLEAGRQSRSLLHVVTDWPGHHPAGAASVAALVAAGAQVNARCAGPHTETPLHWAASSDDVDVLDALLDAGADIEAGGAVVGGGTPLDDAVAFGQWRAARRLVARGARTSLFNAAALGLDDRVTEQLAAEPPPPAGQVTAALWAACHGGQQATAEYLLERGAELNWVAPWDGLTPLEAARRSNAHQVADWLARRGGKPAAGPGTS